MTKSGTLKKMNEKLTLSPIRTKMVIFGGHQIF